ncbi:MAG: hydrolase or metal-binding protein [Burkholderiales bacterium]|nr:hydrolase or metal-binding protein [Burkholderiales bacterium]
MASNQLGRGLSGLAITPPVLGRISIGRVIERNGKRLPEKDDQFTITTQIRDADGWRLHPLDESLRAGQGKLRAIPVRLLFNDPDLNLRASYTAFDRQSARPVCTGNGETCQRSTLEGVKALPCPSPDHCELAAGGACRPYGRLNVLLGDDDATGTFVFRTTGFNSIRTLTARLHYLAAVSGGLLSCLPLELRVRGKSTAQSKGTPIFYVDLVIRSGLTLEAAISEARGLAESRKAAGFDQEALDQAARLGFERGLFEDSEEDTAAVVEEFFPVEVDAQAEATATKPVAMTGLRQKLGERGAQNKNSAMAQVSGSRHEPVASQNGFNKTEGVAP